MAQHKSFVSACKKFEQELVLYYYDELAGNDRNKVDSHIAACEPCRLYLAEMRSLLPLTVAADSPPQTFWDDYSREMRHKLAAVQESPSWWQSFLSLLQPRRVPAFAATAVILIALTLTFGKGLWRTNDLPQDDEAFMEVLPVTENLEFFTHLEVLDSLDLLEFLGSQGNGAV
jgi:hypothetical protein